MTGNPAAPGTLRLPAVAPGMRIGLYGGTFDPPHAGHLHVALRALNGLALHRVWWIVTPANPIKGHRPFRDKAERLAAVRALARHPRMAVADLERGAAPAYTADTVRLLRRRCPGVHLVWIMGADSLAGLHRWRRWRAIAGRVALAAIDRPGWTHKAVRAPAAVALRRRRRTPAGLRGDPTPPAWAILHGKRSALSSTQLRDRAAAAPCA